MAALSQGPMEEEDALRFESGAPVDPFDGGEREREREGERGREREGETEREGERERWITSFSLIVLSRGTPREIGWRRRHLPPSLQPSLNRQAAFHNADEMATGREEEGRTSDMAPDLAAECDMGHFSHG